MAVARASLRQSCGPRSAGRKKRRTAATSRTHSNGRVSSWMPIPRPRKTASRVRAVRAQPRQRTEHQASRDSRNRAAPISVHPIPQRPELDHREQSAHQRPTGRSPRAQHPISTARTSAATESTTPAQGLPKISTPQRQRDALPEREDRAVSGLLQHENGFEELRAADAADWPGGSAARCRPPAGARSRPSRWASARDFAPAWPAAARWAGSRAPASHHPVRAASLRAHPPSRACASDQQDEQQRQFQFDEIARAETDRIVQRQK